MSLGRMLAMIAALASCATAEAQLFRSYLASDGDDANACTLLAPCRLLPRALTAVADGGEIWMLDSANFNTGQVDVEKSVTILAIPGALGSVVATGFGSALNIATPGVKVTLRNLVLKHLTSSNNGINFYQGAELDIADCEISNMTNAGLSATAAGGRVTIRNTVVRGSGAVSTRGIHIDGTLVASLDGVHANGNGLGIDVRGGAQVAIGNSVISGNAQYGVWVSTGTGAVRVAIERTAVTGNANGIQVQASGSGGAAELVVSRSTLSHNGSGVQASQGPSAATNVVLDGNTIAENSFGGVQFAGGSPVIFTRGNNTLKFNGATGTSDVIGGTLTALAAQ